MSTQPLAEVFGFPIDNASQKAERYRKNRLCPYNNRVANCTKDKANNPLGVCSIFDTSGNIAITCPIRFRQDWLITEDAAAFFFPSGVNWTSLTEVRLNDRYGNSAGNIDIVLVAYDNSGQILDFGAVEVQAVYISGNVRRPFEGFISDPYSYQAADFSRTYNRPRPDYLSSSRKRLAPQLIYKGGILKSWGKKQAVVLHKTFFDTLPDFDEVNPDEADIVWLIYDLELDPQLNVYQLVLSQRIYTAFRASLERITTPEAGELVDFVGYLQDKLDEKLEDDDSPDAPTLDQLL